MRAAHAWPWVFLVAGAVGYPFAVRAALQHFGVRPVAAGALLLAVATLAVELGRWRGKMAEARWWQIPGACLGLVALATGARWPLLLVPALIQVGLAWHFANSLREPSCVALRVARFMQPALLDWVDGYCRKLTLGWAFFFAGNAGAIAWLALLGPPDLWLAYTGSVLWLAVGGLQLAEFLVRKAWFRYYDDSLLDRVLQPIFPPENTARGRRSMAYIQRMHREIEGGA